MASRIDRRQFAALLAPAVGVAWPRGRRPGQTAPAVSAATSAAAPPAIRPPDADFLAQLPALMETAGVPGIGLCVVQDGRVVAQFHHGVADAASRRPVAADTLWVAASLSKPVCAFAALRLAEAGRLDLDRPLRAYVPDHAPADARGDRVTARHVLAHASGYPNWRERDDEPLVPAFEPGTRFRYSGEGFVYLQRAIEAVTGTGFGRHVREHLFAPLGMTSTTYGWRADVEPRLVMGHDTQGGRWPIYWHRTGARLLDLAARQGRPLEQLTAAEIRVALRGLTPAPPDRPEFLLPNAASSLLTTTADYGAFLAAALGAGAPAVALREETRRAMARPQTRVNGALAWGLGWGLESAAEPGPGAAPAGHLWHWGDNGSWKSFVLAHPASRSALAVFTNGARGLNVAERVARAATGRDPAPFLWL